VASLSPSLIIFVVAMAAGTIGHDVLYARASATPTVAQAKVADG
jgi:hypothetical protein